VRPDDYQLECDHDEAGTWQSGFDRRTIYARQLLAAVPYSGTSADVCLWRGMAHQGAAGSWLLQ